MRNSMKLIGALGVVGLVMSLGAPRSGAEVSSFSAAIYSNRYVCALTTDFDFQTAVAKYNPNGAGGYTAGTLIASLNGFDTDAAGQSGFCQYSLDTTSSFYTIDGHGLGFEKLVWTAAASNDTACPDSNPAASFTDLTAIAVRNVTNANGQIIEAEVSSDNLLDQGEAGHGYCLK
jgi:hypothetical protein